MNRLFTFSAGMFPHFIFFVLLLCVGNLSARTVCEASSVESVLTTYTNDSGIFFQAEKGKESVNVWWLKTSAERVKMYVLEYSALGSDWTEIYTTSETERGTKGRYVYVHAAPGIGKNHYRLRTEYENGEALYSEMRTVVFSDRVFFNLYPNPADSYVNLDLSEAAGEPVTLWVYDNLGKERMRITIDAADESPVRLDLRDLVDGSYFVHIGAAKRRRVTKVLTINRLHGWSPEGS